MTLKWFTFGAFFVLLAPMAMHVGAPQEAFIGGWEHVAIALVVSLGFFVLGWLNGTDKTK